MDKLRVSGLAYANSIAFTAGMVYQVNGVETSATSDIALFVATDDEPISIKAINSGRKFTKQI